MATVIKEGRSYLSEPRTQMLVEKWKNKISVVEKTINEGSELSQEKRACLARVLENTDTMLKSRLVEGVQSSDIGQYKRYAIDLVTTVVPNLIAFDIVSVQPIENRVGMINYIKYQYNSTKGTTNKGTVFADARNMYQSDSEYTARVVSNEPHTLAASTGKSTLAWTPVVPGSVSIVVGSTTYVDNGAGDLLSGATDKGDINYETGEFTISEAATSAAAITYQYNNEFIPANNIPEIGLSIESKPITATTRRLKAFYSFEAAFELQKEYGEDMQEILNTQAAAEISHEVDVEICNDLYTLANAGTELTWSKAQPTGVSLADHYDSFLTTLMEGAAAIHQATRRVSANFAVLGTQAGVVAASVRTFKPSGVTNITGPYFLGTLGGFKLYVNPSYPVNSFVLGYKGENLLNSGYVYAPYMPILTTDLVQLEDMAGRKGWATMYGKLMLNDQMYIRGRVTA